ncbi:hypothetical protein [Cellulomonas sp. PhB150]|uniref:hypothetical protein n=1 Tax=Cellulomonas sp. PhB150 TaxID=2485188 RepID=UPI000F49CDB9|nr:hypothetical protein [Cellulomonas sp. PhB150]ROS23133.1 hypothetical protein EDF34_3309 [Cellulomonas sp. PhB150]
MNDDLGNLLRAASSRVEPTGLEVRVMSHRIRTRHRVRAAAVGAGALALCAAVAVGAQALQPTPPVPPAQPSPTSSTAGPRADALPGECGWDLSAHGADAATTPVMSGDADAPLQMTLHAWAARGGRQVEMATWSEYQGEPTTATMSALHLMVVRDDVVVATVAVPGSAGADDTIGAAAVRRSASVPLEACAGGGDLPPGHYEAWAVQATTLGSGTTLLLAGGAPVDVGTDACGSGVEALPSGADGYTLEPTPEAWGATIGSAVAVGPGPTLGGSVVVRTDDVGTSDATVVPALYVVDSVGRIVVDGAGRDAADVNRLEPFEPFDLPAVEARSCADGRRLPPGSYTAYVVLEADSFGGTSRWTNGTTNTSSSGRLGDFSIVSDPIPFVIAGQ